MGASLLPVAVLACALLLSGGVEAAQQRRLQQGPRGPRGPVGPIGPTTCVTRGQALQRGSCQSFSSVFKQNADQYMSLNDEDFLKVVNENPQPGTQCCSDARSFISNGCTCDPTIVSYNTQQGLSDNQLKAVTRATQMSQCSWPASGGWINDPCRTTSRVVMPASDNSGNGVLYDIQLGDGK